jgi:hypothetical protein
MALPFGLPPFFAGERQAVSFYFEIGSRFPLRTPLTKIHGATEKGRALLKSWEVPAKQ